MIFETVSFHIVKPCNMKCKFCYATFQDMRITKQLPLEEAILILDKLKDAGVQKVTFAGGEPLLYKNLIPLICHAKDIGLVTSIITNGSLLNDELLQKFVGKLDWIGISVDSLNEQTNEKIGRTFRDKVDYWELVDKINALGIKLKINTVVNIHNENESMQEFINYAKPKRWKIFDTLRVEGQNEQQFEDIKSSPTGFNDFISRHKYNYMVPENNQAMTGSYLLIDPQGRLFENSKGKHTYSSPLQHSSISKCLSEIELNRETFISRGGIYEW